MPGPVPMKRGAKAHRSRRALLFGVALAVLVALPYLAGGRLRTFISLDDDSYVSQNPVVLQGLTLNGVRWALGTFHASNWHPVTWLSHMLDASLFGAAAGGHHLTSILIHALNTALLALVLVRLTGALWASVFAAGLFGVHPLRVESVAWVAERKDTLAGLFFLLVVLAHERQVRRRGGGGRLFVAVPLTLGLMAKPVLVTAPFVLLLLDYWPLGRLRSALPGQAEPRLRRTWRGLAAEKTPLLILALIAGAVTFLAQREGGAVRDLARLPAAVRLLHAPVSTAITLARIAWPSSLGVYYPHPFAVPPGWQAAGALLVLALVSLAAVRWARRRPSFVVGWLWFLVMLAPMSGLLQVGSQARADRYTYLPAVGLALLAAWLLRELLGPPRARAPLPAAGAVLLLGALSAMTVLQVGHWKDSESILRHTLAVTAENPLIESNLGSVLLESGRLDEAIAHYRKALRLSPGTAKAHQDLGIALARAGQVAAAIAHDREAIRLDPSLPGPHSNLAGLLAEQGQLEEAIALCRAALRLQPDHPNAHNNLGLALTTLGRFEEGDFQIREAIRLDPGNVAYRQNLLWAQAAAARGRAAGGSRR